MASYTVRCRNSKCRHRRTIPFHPDYFQRTPRCLACGEQRGWRVEKPAKRIYCHCNGPDMASEGRHYPHRTDHPFCDKHPRGYYNQARFMGIPHDEIPVEFGGGLTPEKEEELCQGVTPSHLSQNNQESIA
jgi:hypothetical protein